MNESCYTWNNPLKASKYPTFPQVYRRLEGSAYSAATRSVFSVSILPKPTAKQPTPIGGRAFEWGSKTFVMGVINATTDSFSGDGIASNVGRAVEMARSFSEWGCDIVDVGGESTRPALTYADAAPTSEAEELERVVPAIEAIARAVDIPVSVDTYKASVARAAVQAGASLVNDVWALQRDPQMIRVVVETGVAVVLMHNQDHARYHDLVPDVIKRLGELRDWAISSGVAREKIILDPGVGFGKTARQNLDLLGRLDELQTLRAPVLVGTSRKSTIGRVLGLPADQRIEGTSATVALSIAAGVDIVRVHDVREMVRVARMSDAVIRGWCSR